jgi:hypothetical protein
MMGQINLVLIGQKYINPKGSFTLITGALTHEPQVNFANASAANGAVEGFVRAAAIELENGIRINAVSPTVIEDSPQYFLTSLVKFNNHASIRIYVQEKRIRKSNRTYHQTIIRVLNPWVNGAELRFTYQFHSSTKDTIMVKTRQLILITVLASLLSVGSLQAQHKINLVRYDDDFTSLKNDRVKKGLDNLKYLPLLKNFYISLGGELREQLQYYNINFGDIPQRTPILKLPNSGTG